MGLFNWLGMSNSDTSNGSSLDFVQKETARAKKIDNELKENISTMQSIHSGLFGEYIVPEIPTYDGTCVVPVVILYKEVSTQFRYIRQDVMVRQSQKELVDYIKDRVSQSTQVALRGTGYPEKVKIQMTPLRYEVHDYVTVFVSEVFITAASKE